eukprot:306109_1
MSIATPSGHVSQKYPCYKDTGSQPSYDERSWHTLQLDKYTQDHPHPQQNVLSNNRTNLGQKCVSTNGTTKSITKYEPKEENIESTYKQPKEGPFKARTAAISKHCMQIISRNTMSYFVLCI